MHDAHFNYVPGIDRDILVSSAYTGGITVADNTDPANPVEIGYYKAGDPIAANTWSTYWHNGFVYANDIARGFDVFSLTHPAVAGAVLLERDNPQTEERLVPWAGDSRRVAASAAVPAGRAEPPRDQSVGLSAAHALRSRQALTVHLRPVGIVCPEEGFGTCLHAGA